MAVIDHSEPRKKSTYKYIEHHETEPHYLRPPLFSKVRELMSDVPHLKNVRLSKENFHFESSWFSMLWICQRATKVSNPDEENASFMQQHISEEVSGTSAAISSVQFLTIFRFSPDPLLTA